MRGLERVRYLRSVIPSWADRRAIARIYRECKRLRRHGRAVVVDHIVPIVHPRVCGLHVENNLQIVGECYNLAKSNHDWPDSPHENHDLFAHALGTEQYALSL